MAVLKMTQEQAKELIEKGEVYIGADLFRIQNGKVIAGIDTYYHGYATTDELKAYIQELTTLVSKMQTLELALIAAKVLKTNNKEVDDLDLAFVVRTETISRQEVARYFGTTMDWTKKNFPDKVMKELATKMANWVNLDSQFDWHCALNDAADYIFNKYNMVIAEEDMYDWL